MRKNKKTDNQITPAEPKKRLFNVEKRFGYTMHEIWRNKMSYGLVAPFFIAFIIFSLIPLVVSTALSFFYYNILQDPTWYGWKNYIYLFVDDSLFLKAFSNTMYFAIILGPVGYIMQYFFAWFINQTPKKLKPMSLSMHRLAAAIVVWLVVSQTTARLPEFLLADELD